MESNLTSNSPYLDESEESLTNVENKNNSSVKSDEPVEVVNSINNEDTISPATIEVIAEKINNEDPYVQLLRESIPEDASTRRRIAYNILRAMLVTRKGGR